MPLGTLINAVAIIAGSLAGLFFHDHIPERVKKIVFQALGLCVLLIGLQMAFKVGNILTVIFSLLLGSIAGELLNLESYVERAGRFLKRKLQSQEARFTEGFVAASVLFCIGAMAILGPLNEGLKGDRTVLLTKSILDGFAAVAMASSYGIGVLFSAIPILIYQGAVFLFAHQLQGVLSDAVIRELTATGGLLITGISLNLLEIKKIKVTNMLPALLFAVAIAVFFG